MLTAWKPLQDGYLDWISNQKAEQDQKDDTDQRLSVEEKFLCNNNLYQWNLLYHSRSWSKVKSGEFSESIPYLGVLWCRFLLTRSHCLNKPEIPANKAEDVHSLKKIVEVTPKILWNLFIYLLLSHLWSLVWTAALNAKRSCQISNHPEMPNRMIIYFILLYLSSLYCSLHTVRTLTFCNHRLTILCLCCVVCCAFVMAVSVFMVSFISALNSLHTVCTPTYFNHRRTILCLCGAVCCAFVMAVSVFIISFISALHGLHTQCSYCNLMQSQA